MFECNPRLGSHADVSDSRQFDVEFWQPGVYGPLIIVPLVSIQYQLARITYLDPKIWMTIALQKVCVPFALWVRFDVTAASHSPARRLRRGQLRLVLTLQG